MSETLSQDPDTLGSGLGLASGYTLAPAYPATSSSDPPGSNLPPFSTFSADMESAGFGSFTDSRLLDISNWDYYTETRLLERGENGLSIITSQPQYRPWESKPLDSQAPTTVTTFADAFAQNGVSKLPSFQSQFQSFNDAVTTTEPTLTTLTPVSPNVSSPTLTTLGPNFHTLNARNYPLVPAPIQAREIPSIQQQFLDERHIQLYTHPTSFAQQNGTIIQNISQVQPTVVTVIKSEPDLKLMGGEGLKLQNVTLHHTQFQNPMSTIIDNNGLYNGLDKKINGINTSMGSPTRSDFRKKERRKMRASSLESSAESDGASSNMDINSENSGQVAAVSSTASFKHHSMSQVLDQDDCGGGGGGGGSDKQVKKKRKRCGECIGCQRKDNCGDCAPCRNDKSHQICKQRRCEKLTEKKNLYGDPYARGESRRGRGKGRGAGSYRGRKPNGPVISNSSAPEPSVPISRPSPQPVHIIKTEPVQQQQQQQPMAPMPFYADPNRFTTPTVWQADPSQGWPQGQFIQQITPTPAQATIEGYTQQYPNGIYQTTYQQPGFETNTFYTGAVQVLTNARPPSVPNQLTPRTNGSYTPSPSPVQLQQTQQQLQQQSQQLSNQLQQQQPQQQSANNQRNMQQNAQYHQQQQQEYVNQNYAPPPTPPNNMDNQNQQSAISRPSSVNSNAATPNQNFQPQQQQQQQNGSFAAVSSTNFSPSSNSAPNYANTNSGNDQPGYPTVSDQPLASHNSNGYSGQYGGHSSPVIGEEQHWVDAENMMWDPPNQHQQQHVNMQQQQQIESAKTDQQQYENDNNHDFNQRININSRIKSMILNKQEKKLEEVQKDEHNKTGHFLWFSHHRRLKEYSDGGGVPHLPPPLQNNPHPKQILPPPSQSQTNQSRQRYFYTNQNKTNFNQTNTQEHHKFAQNVQKNQFYTQNQESVIKRSPLDFNMPPIFKNRNQSNVVLQQNQLFTSNYRQQDSSSPKIVKNQSVIIKPHYNIPNYDAKTLAKIEKSEPITNITQATSNPIIKTDFVKKDYIHSTENIQNLIKNELLMEKVEPRSPKPKIVKDKVKIKCEEIVKYKLKKTINDEDKIKSNMGVEIPQCDCFPPDRVPPEPGTYYTHLGCSSNLINLRKDLESRTGLNGKAIRIEKVCYTGKEGKTSQGCPLAKWIIRRSNYEEKYLIIVKQRKGHFCFSAFIVICIVAWEGVVSKEADNLYALLSEKLNKFGVPTSRRCATNEHRTCACQGLNPDKCGASFSFGCSWSMYYNGCKFARSKIVRKFRLSVQSEEEMLHNKLETLATCITPLYKILAPISFDNQCKYESEAKECRLGLERGRPFSGVTACLDFCAHAHKDTQNMNSGCTVVVTLTKERSLNKGPDEQLHVLPLYTVDNTDEYGLSQDDKIKKGSIEVLNRFQCEVRVRTVPLQPCRRKKRKDEEPQSKKETSPKTTKQSSPSASAYNYPQTVERHKTITPELQNSHISSTVLNSPKQTAYKPNILLSNVQRFNESEFTNLQTLNMPPNNGNSSPKLTNMQPKTPVEDFHRRAYEYSNLNHSANAYLQRSDNRLTNYYNPVFDHNYTAFNMTYPELLPIQDKYNNYETNYNQYTIREINPYVSINQKVQDSYSGLNSTSNNSYIKNYNFYPGPESQQSQFKVPTQGHIERISNPFDDASGICSPVDESVNYNYWYTNALKTDRDVANKSSSDVSLGQVTDVIDNLDSFKDSTIGGVAIALSHGSVLFECAKYELHATTALKTPNRMNPTRISLVFYQHRNLNKSKHGWDEYEEKMRLRKMGLETTNSNLYNDISDKMRRDEQILLRSPPTLTTMSFTTLFPMQPCIMTGPYSPYQETTTTFG